MVDLDSPHWWVLKGQGNANAVFEYIGKREVLVRDVTLILFFRLRALFWIVSPQIHFLCVCRLGTFCGSQS